MENKKIQKSKTIWFGTALIILGAIQTILPELNSIIPQDYYGLISALVGAAIAILRFVTKQPVG